MTAVASRDLQRCRHFIAECQRHAPFDPPPQAFGSYEELLASDTVDAVYVPLPTGVRKAWLIRAAEAGKHVLAEKPVAATAGDVREILAACRRNGVQFMDGVMFMHSRRLDRIREVLDDGESVGQIRRIVSQFSFGAPPEFFQGNIRTHSGLEPLGCLGDLGWYCIRFTLWVLDGNVADAGLRPPAGQPPTAGQPGPGPDRVLGRTVLSRGGVGQPLLFLPGGEPAVGQRQRDQGIRLRAGLRAAPLRQRGGLRGLQRRLPRGGVRFQHGGPPAASWPCTSTAIVPRNSQEANMFRKFAAVASQAGRTIPGPRRP